jgi:processing peptidase subunit alpha
LLISLSPTTPPNHLAATFASPPTRTTTTTPTVIIDVGARYETEDSSGAAYFLDRLAYKSTTTQDGMSVMSEIERLGGNFMCSSNRETVMFHAMVFNKDLEATMKMLADVAMSPGFTEEEIEQQRFMVEYEQQELADKPDVYVSELVHNAAYGSATLGNAQICSLEDAAAMTGDKLHSFWKQYTRPERVVIAAAGPQHEEIEALAEKYFGEKLQHALPGGGGDVDVPPPPRITPVYTGGSQLVHLPDSPVRDAYGKQLAQLAVGFKGVPWSDDELYPIAVLQLLLGGGFSFSVGGPGKGMFARMYKNVMNYHHWINSAVAMNLSYNDCGTFYIQGGCPPNRTHDLLSIMVREVENVAESVTMEETARARNQLKSSLLMNLESKSITAEDIGRQVLGLGRRVSADELISHIEVVEPDDITRVTRKMIASPPVLAGYGDLSHMKVGHQDVAAVFAAKSKSLGA